MHMAEVELERSIRNEELQRLLKIEKSLVFFITSLRGNDNLLIKMKTLKVQRQFFDEDLVEDVEIDINPDDLQIDAFRPAPWTRSPPLSPTT